MNNDIAVILLEKLPEGDLRQIDERIWTPGMVTSLEHVNYITVGGSEYETLEGRLNLDKGKLEILVVPVRNE
ncbi:hypothetical protein [Cohnella zeiphila]|uniref:Uncharacterized protein n=1 Tax=Cohnella zeiphila TaxID=2761120 RepID=A0A7X0SKX8_9BACL|nr:hypothetical protein [Cohnella zeiphila]MBB6730724.1 hypothetical protein [Cohnella zeiphila]